MSKMGTDPYLDPELHDPERPCTACGRHQGECDGPPARCCEACEHWTADDLATAPQHAPDTVTLRRVDAERLVEQWVDRGLHESDDGPDPTYLRVRAALGWDA